MRELHRRCDARLSFDMDVSCVVLSIRFAPARVPAVR